MRFLASPQQHDLTYSDVFLVPGRSGVSSRFDVDLTPGDGTPATLPIVAANMNSVTGKRLAATLARRGGLGVLPQDLGPDTLVAAVEWVKAQSPFWDTPTVLPPKATVGEALTLMPPYPGHAIVLRRKDGAVRGVVSAERLAEAPSTAKLEDLVDTWGELSPEAASTSRGAFEVLEQLEADVAPVMDGGRLLGIVSRRSAVRSGIYRPAVDGDGRLAVAAALGINGDVASRARALVEAGVDVLVLDTAHGHQDGMIRAVGTVAALGLGVPIVAGNVVTPEAVADLTGAGATIVKVGVGPGAMCTTRMMTGVGRPQFSAVLETAEAARAAGAHVWADGGVRYPRDVALALAAGAASVMIGSWFAGTIEAPGALERDSDGRWYKQSWGMASTKAVRARFGGLDAYELARKSMFAEGISSSRIYLDPLRPGLEDLLDMIDSGVRSSFTYAGARTVPEFRERSVVGIQSAAGYEEGKALPVSW